MFRDDDDAARARARALEIQNKELKEALEVKNEQLREQASLLDAQAQKIQEQQRLVPNRMILPPTQPKDRALLIVILSVLASMVIIFGVVASVTTRTTTPKTNDAPVFVMPEPLFPPAPPEPKKSNTDELDELLGSNPSGPEALSAAEINNTMSKVNFSPCTAIGTGKVLIQATINSRGSVTQAKNDGTPLGNCVAGIVRRVKFPSISSPSQTFPYPVIVK